MKNRSMPSNDIIPVLAYPDIDAAAHWLCTVLGFRLRWKAGNHRAQLLFKKSAIAITEARQPFTSRGITMMLQVDDVNLHFENAKAAGATILSPPSEYPYGERQYTLQDPGGHHWTFSQSVTDLLPEDWGGESFDLS
jgi:uncharacterized glyoxalase superfamily protein PhnB